MGYIQRMAPMTAASKITILWFSLSQYLRFGSYLGEQGNASRWSWPSVRFVSFTKRFPLPNESVKRTPKRTPNG